MKVKSLKTRLLVIAVIILLIFPLSVNAASPLKNIDGLKIFHGKWESNRWVPEGYYVHQTLKIRCNNNTNICQMTMIAEESRSCSTQFGEPTDALLKAKNEVTIIDNSISFFVDAYCKTSPISYSFSFPVTYTYNPEGDTLTDNLGVVWYRK